MRSPAARDCVLHDTSPLSHSSISDDGVVERSRMSHAVHRRLTVIWGETPAQTGAKSLTDLGPLIAWIRLGGRIAFDGPINIFRRLVADTPQMSPFLHAFVSPQVTKQAGGRRGEGGSALMAMTGVRHAFTDQQAAGVVIRGQQPDSAEYQNLVRHRPHMPLLAFPDALADKRLPSAPLSSDAWRDWIDAAATQPSPRTPAFPQKQIVRSSFAPSRFEGAAKASRQNGRRQ